MMDQDALSVLAIILIVAGLIYLIPTFVAFYRKHPNRWPIFLVNLVFGCSVIGWVGSLIWALHAVHQSPTGNNGGETGLNVFMNDVGPGARATISNDAVQSLTKLKSLLDEGVITQTEFAAMKEKYLKVALQ